MRSRTVLSTIVVVGVLAIAGSQAKGIPIEFWEFDVTLQPGEVWSHHEIDLNITHESSTWIWIHWQTLATTRTWIQWEGWEHLLPGETASSQVQSDQPFLDELWLTDTLTGVQTHQLVDVTDPSANPQDLTLPFEDLLDTTNEGSEELWWQVDHHVTVEETFVVDNWLHLHEHYFNVDLSGVWVSVENTGSTPITFDVHKMIVPEPTGLALLAFGGLVLARRRQR